MSTEIQTVPSPNSAKISSSGSVGITPAAHEEEEKNHPIANATSPDQLPKPKRDFQIINPFKKRSKSESNLPSLNTLSGVTNPQTEVPGDKTSSSTAKANIHNSSQSVYRLITRELEYIEDTSEQLKNYNGLVEEKLEDAKQKLDLIKKAMEDGATPTPDNNDGEEIEKELRQFKKYIRKMKLPIPSKFKTNAADLRNQWNLGGSTQTAQQFAASLLKGALPKFHNNPVFENSPAFRDFEVRYKSLPIHLKLCLLCFAVFPEGEIIKKRLMVYWWIGEGFVGSPAENPQQDCNRENEDQVSKLKDAEQLGAEYFDALIRLDFIEAYSDKRCPEVDSCRMHAFVRSAVITLAARAKFFDFDANGKPKAFCPSSFRSCLIGNDGLDNDHDFEKIHLLFNVDETILEIKPEWFPKMRNVNVLCLGRWQAKASHHIEVEDTKFLEALSCMKHLKFLSLQGISRIMELPNSVTKLGNLTILDLRACHNLEVIPRDIGLLKSLTHLDLSECYLLDKMPKGLSFLKNLLVLKGFVVVKTKDSCSLGDLAKLPKLRKLSIFTGLKDFPDEEDLNAFPQFKVLSKLKVVWGGGANKEDKNVNKKPSDISEGDGDTVVAKQENHEASSSREIDTPPPANVEDNNCAATNPPVSEPAAAAPEPAPVPEPALPPTPANVGDNKKGLDKPIKPQQPAGAVSKLLPAFTRTRGTPIPVIPGLPDQLQKLDLQCFPEKFAPKWLKPAKLQELKKLYIRGGQLCDLVGDHELLISKVEPWNVEILRLKYLSGLGMNWKELRELFPELIYLEKVKCPKLTLFPCDEAGVWLDKKKIEKQ